MLIQASHAYVKRVRAKKNRFCHYQLVMPVFGAWRASASVYTEPEGIDTVVAPDVQDKLSQVIDRAVGSSARPTAQAYPLVTRVMFASEFALIVLLRAACFGW